MKDVFFFQSTDNRQPQRSLISRVGEWVGPTKRTVSLNLDAVLPTLFRFR